MKLRTNLRYILLAPVLTASVLTLVACQQESTPSIAAAEPAPAATEDVDATIIQLERDWVNAIVKKDTSTLERLMAADFNGTSPTAHTYPRELAISDLRSGKYVVESMTLDEISVNAFGDVAVAFTSQEEKSRYEGQDTSGHYHFTDTWIKRNGQWQVVASHGTKYDKGHTVEKG
jgi:ketosteroid isomerase-like protein